MRPTTAIAIFGSITEQQISGFGRFTTFCASAFRVMLLHPLHSLRWRLLGPQLFAVGVLSIPVVAITGAFIGMILSLEGYSQFAAIGQQDRMGGIINISVVKQIGPVLAAVMVAGRVGCALAAELGTMRVTEQLDAMRAIRSSTGPQRSLPIIALTADVMNEAREQALEAGADDFVAKPVRPDDLQQAINRQFSAARQQT